MVRGYATQADELSKRYEALSFEHKHQARGRRVVCLDIPDNYEFMQPELIELLKMRARHFLPATRGLRWRRSRCGLAIQFVPSVRLLDGPACFGV